MPNHTGPGRKTRTKRDTHVKACLYDQSVGILGFPYLLFCDFSYSDHLNAIEVKPNTEINHEYHRRRSQNKMVPI